MAKKVFAPLNTDDRLVIEYLFHELNYDFFIRLLVFKHT